MRFGIIAQPKCTRFQFILLTGRLTGLVDLMAWFSMSDCRWSTVQLLTRLILLNVTLRDQHPTAALQGPQVDNTSCNNWGLDTGHYISSINHSSAAPVSLTILLICVNARSWSHSGEHKGMSESAGCRFQQ